MKNYNNLADLMLNSKEAQLFYDKLPDGMKAHISRNGKHITSVEQLETFATKCCDC